MLYGRSHLPLNDQVLLNARFLNINERCSVELSQVLYFVNRYSLLFPFSHDPIKLKILKDEFYSYQLLEDKDIPIDVYEKAAIISDYGEHVQSAKLFSLDIIWDYVSSRKASDGRLQFHLLSNVAQLVLIMPHSNAFEERGFSMIQKNRTPFRPNLDPE